MVPAQIAAPAIAREFRAAWLSPVWRPDWPSRPGLTPAAQRAELRALFDQARVIGLNAIVLHVRMAADAIYPTTHAPWSSYLTGEVGRAPEPRYDPLQFAIDEAHARGLELHAWFNPFRAAPPGSSRAASDPNALTYGTQKWLDPGLPEVRSHVLAAIVDVIDRYDIDGIHLDDYFYPYLEENRSGTIPFPDSLSWRLHGAASGTTRGDWRRANINGFVESLYRQVKARKPTVAVGISPFGIWKSGVPAGISGLNAYTEIFADARLWLREGWVDYIVPQLYWPIEGTQRRFLRLDEWWRNENVKDRHVWPGLHTEREFYGENRWSAGELVRQIDTLRARRRNTDDALGHVHFRMRAASALSDSLRTRYATPALPPAMPWLDDRAPARPQISVLPPTGSGTLLRVSAGDTVPVRWFAVQTRGDDGVWQLSLVRSSGTHVLRLPGATPPTAVSVRAISAAGVASTASVLARTQD